MPAHTMLEASLALLPVLLFLGGLLFLDSFRVAGPLLVGATLLAGAGAGVASYLISGGVMDLLHLSFAAYSQFAAPVLEEALKAAVILVLFRLDRIGFLVDAAILGLATGAGFSLFENIYYAFVFPDANAAVWLVRGLGTALMHGGTAALFALTAQAMRDRDETTTPLDYLPCFLIAVALHLIFNQFTAYPLASAAGTLLALPMALLFLFDRSEQQMHDCLVQEYQDHEALLADIRSGKFQTGRTGRVIRTWAARRNPALVTSIFAYIKLHTELVVRAEAQLLAKEKSETPPPPVDPAAFQRLHALERQIGKSALLTLKPHLKFNRRQLFELDRLEAQATQA